MFIRIVLMLAPALVLATAAGAVAQETEPVTENTLTLAAGAERPRATAADVSWIAGHWKGEGLGGRCEEVWTGPDAGALMGMFRAVGDDGVMFYEFFTIAEDEGTLVLRLKHFNRDVTGWEEKDQVVTYPLAKIEEHAAYFDGLTYRREGDTLRAYVVMKGKDGDRKELAFTYALQ